MEIALGQSGQREASIAVDPPLCVDLDGTLVKSDTLWDGLCLFARMQPLQLWRCVSWLPHGKAHFKNEIARRAPLDVERLPYNADLLDYLQDQHRAGRHIYLATGADGVLAERVAAHLGIFDGVLASDGAINLTAHSKLDRLRQQFGTFDYIGNARADLSLLAGARQAMIANPTLGLRRALRSNGTPILRTFNDRRPAGPMLIKAIRLHQWAKNILIFAPLLLSHKITPSSVAAAFAAFFCLSFMASANYIVNDLLDLESDRRHPGKRRRPFAAGDLPVSTGIALACVFSAGSLAILPFLPLGFAFWLLIYIVATAAYSLFLKRVAVVDVLLLSGLYTLRMLAGGAATGTVISEWLASFSSFLFLSLAMVKRFSELETMREQGAEGSHGRGYLVADLEQIRSFGTASAYAAAVVFMLYIARPDVWQLYRHGNRLWLMLPLLLYWLNRVWLLASRGELHEDPVVFALRDRMSLIVGALVLAVVLWAL